MSYMPRTAAFAKRVHFGATGSRADEALHFASQLERELADQKAIAQRQMNDAEQARIELAEAKAARPEEKPITTMPLIKRLKDQRDALADAVRLIVQADDMEAHNEAIFKGKWKKGSKAWGGSFIEQTRKEGMEKSRAALEGVPTSEQQLRNIAAGIGMPYEELVAHLSPPRTTGTSPRGDNGISATDAAVAPESDGHPPQNER